MDPETRARLIELNDLIQKEKDSAKLQELVREVLRLFDESKRREQNEKPN
jgi:hypothetical protein